MIFFFKCEIEKFIDYIHKKELIKFAENILIEFVNSEKMVQKKNCKYVCFTTKIMSYQFVNYGIF